MSVLASWKAQGVRNQAAKLAKAYSDEIDRQIQGDLKKFWRECDILLMMGSSAVSIWLVGAALALAWNGANCRVDRWVVSADRGWSLQCLCTSMATRVPFHKAWNSTCHMLPGWRIATQTL